MEFKPVNVCVFGFIICFGLSLLVITVDYVKPRKSYTETIMDVSVARSLLRECTKTLQGTAQVETKWSQDVPESWTITCTY